MVQRITLLCAPLWYQDQLENTTAIADASLLAWEKINNEGYEKSVLDCDAPHAFVEGKMYPSFTLVGSKGHRKDLSVYPKK